MEQQLTHWKKVRNMSYLGSWDLEPGKDLILTIAKVGQETVENPVQKTKEVKTVAHFAEQGFKPMVLNATNCKAIEKVTGTPYMEEWPGHTISIYTAKVRAFGEETDALRVRNKKPDVTIYKCEDCGKVITSAGGKSPSELVEISKRNCNGQALCVACMNKFKKAAEQKAEETPKDPEPVKEEEPKEEAKQDPTDGSEDLGW